MAGTLLVDLDAADFAAGAEKWPQHSSETGIAGDFIASYGSLRGKFTLEDSLPAGYALDYHYHGLNQIALVATALNGLVLFREDRVEVVNAGA